MSSSEIFITKRDGKRERFSIDKIRAAIAKAFLSVGSFATDEMLTQILGRIRVADGTTVEQIQNQVETALMAERYYKVAKAYIIYRQEHTEDREVRDKLQFLMNYCEAKNPATGSKYDANANVENKNMATLIGELPKQNFIRLNRRLLTDRLKEMYGKEVSDRYLELLDRHFIYKNDETSLANYCASITMYPWLIERHDFDRRQFEAADQSQVILRRLREHGSLSCRVCSAGACATTRISDVYELLHRRRSTAPTISNGRTRWSISRRNGARSTRSSPTVSNRSSIRSTSRPERGISRPCSGTLLTTTATISRACSEISSSPTAASPDWESLSWLQKRFMKWFNRERTRTVLTFPVETMALLTENGDVKDKEWGDFTAEMYAEGHSFFTYMSDNADSLSSCCRLRNEITDNGFSYTLGAGGVSTGSKSVLTINLNRCIQYAARKGMPYQFFLEEVVDLVHKVQLAYNENLKYMQSKGMLPLFDAGYINMSRQYLTIGVNGLVEAAEFLGIPINDNPDYERFTQEILGMIEKYNKKYRSKEVICTARSTSPTSRAARRCT